MTDTYKPFRLHEVSDTGHKITAPYVAMRVPHWPRKAQWGLFGHRANVSASVLEPVTAIRFQTRKDALGFLSRCANA